MAKSNDWYVYILRCADDSFYTGITTDPMRRVNEHNAEKSVTKYTRVRQPVTMVYQELVESRSEAGQREAQIKSLTRLQKKALINQKHNELRI